MGELRVRHWNRYGRQRLYVNLPDGRNAAWLDCATGHLTLLLDEVGRDAVLAALAPHTSGILVSTVPAGAVVPPGSSGAPVPSGVPEPPVSAGGRPESAGGWPARRPDVAPEPSPDLAAHRPGEAIHAKLRELRPGFWRSLADRLLRRGRPETAGWRTGLAGERLVAAELAPLAAAGWRVLHSIPLPRDVDIDHLLIGPGGVFTVNTKYHRGRRIWVGDEAVKVDGWTHHYVRKARAEARRASEVLSRACGFGVGVAGVLAFVEAESLTVVPSLRDVLAVCHDDLRHAFDGVTGQWRAEDVERIYAAARDRRIWMDA
ncbi:nuclease-like protein [Frankia sp. EI5c]|uniref:nuclease-related domain-containing protein n=1 Tax=Frankia sp. EI5c TaxID=683316 RepID=UPI0007C3131B|nr:nuclease-related domain-containing protein [Frankia sp. EI5c]OAA27880.1 nuclease-like protein [Frankia sp. EI5c]